MQAKQPWCKGQIKYVTSPIELVDLKKRSPRKIENPLENTSLNKGLLFLCFYISNIFKSHFLCLNPFYIHLTTKTINSRLKHFNLLLRACSVILLVAVYVLCRNNVSEAASFFIQLLEHHTVESKTCSSFQNS
jgi:hypothetical protein